MPRIFIVIFLLGLTACQARMQETSGAEYVVDRQDVPGYNIDKEIAQAAAVEPNLRFPARIGVARIVRGRLTLPAGKEAELLAEVLGRDGRLGEFVPITPLMAASVNGTGLNSYGEYTGTRNSPLVHDIRLTAARQHLDYVLIYEIGTRSLEDNTPLALTDVTLIGGALLPTRNIRIAGVGQALFLDVRNGYPYATTGATRDISGLARTYWTYERTKVLTDRAIGKVAEVLMPEIGIMLQDLLEGAKR